MHRPYVPFRRPSHPWISISATSDAVAAEHLLTLTRLKYSDALEYRLSKAYRTLLRILEQQQDPDPFERGPMEDSDE